MADGANKQPIINFTALKPYILPGTGVSIIVALVAFIFIDLKQDVHAFGQALQDKAAKSEVLGSVELMLDKRDTEHRAYQEDIKELKEKQVKIQEKQLEIQLQQKQAQPYDYYRPPPDPSWSEEERRRVWESDPRNAGQQPPPRKREGKPRNMKNLPKPTASESSWERTMREAEEMDELDTLEEVGGATNDLEEIDETLQAILTIKNTKVRNQAMKAWLEIENAKTY